MSHVRLLTLGLALTLAGTSSPAHAGIFQRIAERHAAKRDFRQTLKADKDLKVYRRGQIGLKSAAVKLGTLGTAAFVEGAGFLSWVDRAFKDGGGGENLVFGTIAAIGVGIAGMKIAASVRRAANTRTVEFALKQGKPITKAQIDSWQKAKIIGELKVAEASGR
jgi:hypothetical protein